MHRSRVRLSVLSGLVVYGLALSCSQEPAQQDRYAYRVVPPSEEWTVESKIPPRRQGIWELSRFAPGTPPTPEQQRAADDLVERAFAAALRHGWHDVDKAIADGFIQPPKDPHHYQNTNYKLDDRILDPDRPEYLMYHPLDGKPYLTGFMFFARTRTERGAQIGGPLTVWHFHTWRRPQCVIEGMLPRGWGSSDGTCEEGVPMYSSGEMLHVWLIDRPDGPFSSSMVVPPDELRAGLTQRLAEKGY